MTGRGRSLSHGDWSLASILVFRVRVSPRASASSRVLEIGAARPDGDPMIPPASLPEKAIPMPGRSSVVPAKSSQVVERKPDTVRPRRSDNFTADRPTMIPPIDHPVPRKLPEKLPEVPFRLCSPIADGSLRIARRSDEQSVEQHSGMSFCELSELSSLRFLGVS